MIETTVKEYLETVIEGIPILLETPKNLPDRFIVFQLIDRGKEDQINAVTLEFRCFAGSKYDAALLDETLRSAMESLHENTDISCHIGGGNDDQDSALKMYRYRSYYNLYY